MRRQNRGKHCQQCPLLLALAIVQLGSRENAGLCVPVTGSARCVIATATISGTPCSVRYYPDIPPSRIGVEQARQAAKHLGLTIDARAVHSREDIQHTMASLRRGEVDAMLTVPNAPIDNVLPELILPVVKQ